VFLCWALETGCGQQVHTSPKLREMNDAQAQPWHEQDQRALVTLFVSRVAGSIIDVQVHSIHVTRNVALCAVALSQICCR
jgi:hypothetical protein